MFHSTMRKFYTFMAFALVLGVIGMQFATTRWDFSSGVSGMVVTESATGDLGGIVFFIVGIVTGAIIVGSVAYLWGYEKKRT